MDTIDIVKISGMILGFDIETYAPRICFEVYSMRRSDVADKIMVLVGPESKKYQECKQIMEEHFIHFLNVTGTVDYRKNKMMIIPQKDALTFYNESTYKDMFREDINSIELQGTVISCPQIRITSQGTTLMDLRLEVGAKQKVPCILFQKIVPVAQNLRIGDIVRIKGRLQYRVFYSRILDDTNSVHEVAVNGLTIIKSNCLTKEGKLWQKQ